MIGGLEGGSKDAEGCDLAFRNLKDQGEGALPETCCQYKQLVVPWKGWNRGRRACW
jgi:hypothetical protein